MLHWNCKQILYIWEGYFWEEFEGFIKGVSSFLFAGAGALYGGGKTAICEVSTRKKIDGKRSIF